MKNNIKIIEVKTKNELKKFIHYPKELYKDCPYYVPSLESDDYQTLTSHPAKSFCEIRMWMAYKNGKLSGRIAGIINHRYNQLKDRKRIRFGWFDFENDIEVAQELLKKVEDWGIMENLTEISGPSRYSNMEKQGLLIEGFDFKTALSCEYNYPYYPEFLDKCGYLKEVDYEQHLVEINEIPEKIKDLSGKILKRYNIRVKQFNTKKELLKYAREFFLALNESFLNIYNFIPLTNEEIEYLIKNNFGVADKDLVCILVDNNDKVIGFSFSVPSLNNAFQKSNGRLLPTGWYHIKKALKKNDTVDLYLTGVLPEWINRGINAAYHYQLHHTFLSKGFKYAVTNQQLESNIGKRIWDKYGGKVITKRRCYLKKLL